MIYLPSYSGTFIWDDDDYVEHNETLRSLDGLRRIWTDMSATPQYYPLVHTSYWIEFRLWGLNPTGYRVVNVLLHATSAWLLARLLRRLEVPGAFWAAALFAAHPVAVESVAWITERKNTLALLFYLLGFHACWNVVDPDVDQSSAADRGWIPRALWPSYAGFLVAYVAALLSKTVAASLPAAVLVVLWWKRGRLAPIDVLRMAPAIALALPLALNTAQLEKTQVGAVGPEFETTLAERILVAGHAVWFYLGKLVWPWPLAFSYERWTFDPRDASNWIAVAALLATLTALVVVAWRRPDPVGRAPLATALLFGGTLLPALGFFNVFPFRFSYVADHFQYLAMPWPLTLIVAAIATIAFRKDTSPRRWVAHVAYGIALVVCGTLTWRQCGDYRDLETLWTRTLAKSPRSSLAWNNLGTIRLAQRRTDEALECFQAAIAAAPLQRTPRVNLVRPLLQLRSIKEAEAALEHAKSMRGSPLGRSRDEDLLDIATILVAGKQGDLAKIRETLARLERLGVTKAATVYAVAGLSLVNREAGELSAADAYHGRMQAAIDARPDLAEFAILAFDDLGRPDLAANLAIAQAKPDKDGQVDLRAIEAAIWQLRSVGRIEEALPLAKAITRSNRTNSAAWVNQGVLSAMLGKWRDAETAFREALAVEPNQPEARSHLAMTLLSAGKPREGLAELELARRDSPSDRMLARMHAWALATHPRKDVRDPRQAIAIARVVLGAGGTEDPRAHDTLAAAQAASGDFAAAAATAEHAAYLASERGETELQAAIESRRNLYLQRLPFVDETFPP